MADISEQLAQRRKFRHGLGIVHCSFCYTAARRVCGESWWASFYSALRCRWGES